MPISPTLRKAAKDNLDGLIKTTLNQSITSLHQAYVAQSLKQAEQNCNKEVWKKVSLCRFVFAQFKTPSETEIKGILFYTDTHYGDSLIVCSKRY